VLWAETGKALNGYILTRINSEGLLLKIPEFCGDKR
jgi:hypothetical protein